MNRSGKATARQRTRDIHWIGGPERLLARGQETSIEGPERLLERGPETSTGGAQPILAASTKNAANSDSSEDYSRLENPFSLIARRREKVWPTAIDLPILAFTQGRVSVNWLR